MSQTTYSVLREFGIGPCGIAAAGVHFAEILHQMADLILTLRAERDKLRDQWSDLLIEQTRLMAMRDEAIAERDALRTVYDAAAVYCTARTVANEHALIDAVGAVKALEVQP